MKFSIGYQICKNDFFINEIIKNKKSVDEVYFSWGDFANGRNIQTVQSDFTPWEAQQRQTEDLTRLHENGVKFNLLFNGSCYGRDSLSRSFFNRVGGTVDYIVTRFNLASVTTTSPIIAKFIKDNFEKIKTRASVNMEIGTVQGMDYLNEYFDGYYMKREYNRDFERIRLLKRWCDDNGKTLHILANSGCLNNCSAHVFHDNLVAHEAEIAAMDNCYSFTGICHKYLKNPEKRVSLVRDTSFIRPEDVKLYEPYFDTIKLATRVSDRPIQILKSYIGGRHSGNILEILEPNHAGRIYPYVIDNGRLKNDYLYCDKNCSSCGKCEENYPDAQRVFYVKDYENTEPLFEGEERNDLPAITKAINAALNCGVPARVEFEQGKTYVLGERMDRWAVIYLEGAQNITLEGNGCEILMKTPTNTFIEMTQCKNVKVRNFDVDYEELPFTQGRITATDPQNGKFTLRIDDGYPMPADDEWVKYHSTDERSGGWWFGQLMDSTEDRMKYTYTDNLFVDGVTDIGNGEYEITISGGADGKAKYAEVNDRFVLNSRYGAYSISDSGTEAKQGSTSEIYLDRCADIEFDGVYMYSTIWMFCGIGLSEGKTTFKNSGFKTKPGRLLAANSDGIHTWLNRGALVLENCTFANSLDDHNNTYTQGGFVRAVTGTAQYKIENEINARVGDEIQVYNPTDKQLLGRAFVKSISNDSDGKHIITLDRDFDNVLTLDNGSQTPTLLYDVDSGSRGNSIKNCTFMYGRRYAVLERSVNSIIENNTVIGCGSGIGAMNELTTETKSEGGFPSSLTIRGNNITGDGNTYGYVPIEIRHWKAAADASRAIDGALIENNSINVPNTLGSMELECINDLYLLNNTVTNSAAIKSNYSPVMIRNCDVEAIDGMTFNCGSGLGSAMKIYGSDVSETDIKNINITAPASAKPYEISETEPVSEDFETGSDADIAGFVFPNDFMSVPEGYKADTALSYVSQNGGKALCVSRTASDYADIGFIANMTDNTGLAKQDGTLTFEFDCKASTLKVQALKDSNAADLLQINSYQLSADIRKQYSVL